jgi:hypothetical protein
MGVTHIMLEVPAPPSDSIADPQRTVLSPTATDAVGDVSDQTAIRDQPIVEAPGKTVARDEPELVAPTVVRKTQKPQAGPSGPPASGPPPGFGPGSGPPPGVKIPAPARLLLKTPLRGWLMRRMMQRRMKEAGGG